MAQGKSDQQNVGNLWRETKIKDVMAVKVKTLYEDDELSKAQEIFMSDHVFYIPIISHDDKLIGLMSHKYLYRTRSPRKFIEGDAFYEPGFLVDGDSYYEKETLDSYILRAMMQRDPCTMRPQESLADAVVTMVKRNLGCLIIVDDNRRVAGMVTDREILFFTARIIEGT